jgi:hypothetical protein
MWRRPEFAEGKKGFLFRPNRGHDGTVLADQPMSQVARTTKLYDRTPGAAHAR